MGVTLQEMRQGVPIGSERYAPFRQVYEVKAGAGDGPFGRAGPRLASTWRTTLQKGYGATVHRWTWWFGLIVGGLLVVAGIAETVRLVRTGDGGFWFWFPTLVGGGALVVAGALLLTRSPVLGCVLTTLGALAGILPTMWTLVVPVLLVVLVVVSAKQAAAAVEAGTTPP